MKIEDPYKLYLIGDPVGHSCSDVIHNTLSDALNLPYRYEIRRVAAEDVGAFADFVRRTGAAGFNITVPHKKAIMPFLDEIDPAAWKIGAVNTVVNRDGRLCGYNTDAPGFLTALGREGISPAGRTVALLGAGGAARGVCYALLSGGARRVLMYNRNVERAQMLCRDFRDLGELSACGLDADKPLVSLLVNTTSVGMHPHPEETPLYDLSFIEPGGFVCDIIYNPPETRLLRLAREQGIARQNGLAMLVYQGVAAYRLFTGTDVPEGVAERVLQTVSSLYVS